MSCCRFKFWNVGYVGGALLLAQDAEEGAFTIPEYIFAGLAAVAWSVLFELD